MICYPLGSSHSELPDVVTTCLVAIGVIISAVTSTGYLPRAVPEIHKDSRFIFARFYRQ